MFKFIVLGLFIAAPGYAQVVSTTTTLKALIQELVPNTIKVSSLAEAGQDPHHLDIEAKHIKQVAGAKLLVAVGFDFESDWLNKLVKAANYKQNTVYVGLSVKQPIAMGKVSSHHSQYNPHFLLSPKEVKEVIEQLKKDLVLTFSSDAKTIEDRYLSFLKSLEATEKKAVERFQSLESRQLISYHESLEYFARNFLITIVDRVEQAHGVGPSPLHLKRLASIIQKQKITCVLYDSSYNQEQIDKIRSLFPNDIKWQVVPSEVGSLNNTTTYLEWFESLSQNIYSCLK